MSRFRVGTVLVVGNDNICTPGAAWENSVLADTWDPGAANWTEAPSLPRPRDRFVLVPLPDGSVLIAGGTTHTEGGPGVSFVSSLRLDVEGGDWLRSGDLTQARSQPAAVALQDGRVLIAGGYYANLPAEPAMRVLRSAEVFDPATETWSRTGSLNTARYGASMVTLPSGQALVLGGWADVDNNWPAPLYGTHVPLRTAELYDPKTGEWTLTGELPSGVAGAALVAIPSGALTVVEGRSFRFDLKTGRWTATGPMVTSADDRTLVALADGRVLAAGGSVRGDEEPVAIAAAEIYEPGSDRWFATARMPAPRSGGSAILLGDGSALVVGGGIPGMGVPSCPMPAENAAIFVPPPP